jgi:hypothetical protein
MCDDVDRLRLVLDACEPVLHDSDLLIDAVHDKVSQAALNMRHLPRGHLV